MSMIRRVILGRRPFRRAVPRRAKEVMSNPDCRPMDLCFRVWYLIASVGDLDTAAKYARLAAFTRNKGEETESTCELIIGSMFGHKRHKDAYDLYDFFFNKHKLRPTNHCCNCIIESRLQQGLVDEALDFHRSIKTRGYPNEDTVRVLTKGLTQSGRLDQAEALLKARKSPLSIYRPDHVAFNNLIRGFLDLGNLDKANLVLDEFKRVWSDFVLSRHKPDSLCLEYEQRVAFLMATFMEYWFKQGNETEAMKCYERCVVANKLPVCADTGNALLKILLKYGKKTHAWALYHDMFDQSESGISTRCLNPGTVKIMVDECFDMGRCSQAIETYNKARAKNNFLNDGYIITRCCENGLLSEAESLLADSLGLGFGVVDVAIFKTMIAAYLNAGRIDDALKTSNMLIDASLVEVSKMF